MEYSEKDNFFEHEVDKGDDTIVEYDITTTPRDLTPASIVDMIDAGIIEIPLFQREYVWDIKKASKLVESLILGLPVPELFFYIENDDDDKYKVIDGQQRLLSIYFFVKGRFPRSSSARLILRKKLNNGNLSDSSLLKSLIENEKLFRDFYLKLNDNGENNSINQYDGKKFGTLDKTTQIKFKLRRSIRAVLVRQNKPDNDESMFEIFNRLNTGGIPLNPQEIRASLYYCDFYKMLIELSNNPKWKKILNNTNRDLHSKDIEIILRAFALLEDGDNYSPKMVNFLNKFSKKSKKFTTDHTNYLYELFLSFLDSCSELEKKAFFRNNRFSHTLFESVFVVVCKKAFHNNKKKKKKIDPESFENLKNDENFTSFLQNGSSSSDNIKGRIELSESKIRFLEED